MRHLYLPYFLLLCLLVPAGCANVPKLLDKGHYERAYEVALRRCTRGRGPLKQKRVDEFFTAYEAVQLADFTHSKSLRRRNDGEKWAELYHVYRDLYARSLDLADLFPADVNFTGNAALLPANLEARREEARRQAGNYILEKAAPLLPAAREGYKPAARTAYHHYAEALGYLPERREKLLPVQDSLADLGTLRILLYAPDQTEAPRLRERLRRYDPLYRYWTAIHTRDPGTRIDLEAEVVYQDYTDSGLQESSSCRTYSEKVLDHIEKKKVKVKVNDTTEVEKIIEIKHYKTVHATVETVTQRFSVSARGLLAVFPAGAEYASWETPLSGGNSWQNEYEKCSGDERALPAFSCGGMRRFPPSTRSLLPGAIRNLADRARVAVVQKYAPRLRREERKVAERWALFR